ncbi:Cd(II)/Pb(II)-responsive transcriptional regulator [Aliikangiella marina]|uniref:Cd(II)/Pb(II)-responsive transcriptional regulator n=1 Tax=Aliikangiella marina TaxID=1712262 RepID=A0A545TJD4_9GAMM|nr:Cd(II)/Pb(II)-responsive transcriptional regulator [Aliikangiella marina]TQV77328.1 Cd(II)/Pb(II)-responsive transcriptional regulator [Aliikangiella marina]
MKIGELARRSGCSIQTIRYYEKLKLLPIPSRSEGNFRLYDIKIFEQLKFIKRCKDLDLTLDEIRKLLSIKSEPNQECDDVNRLIERHLERVEFKIAEFRQLRAQLISLRQACSENNKAVDCGILKQLTKDS